MRKRIFDLFSQPRLTKYCRRGAKRAEYECLVRYLASTKRAESLYYPLHLVEVALRNAIYNAYALYYPQGSFFDLYNERHYTRHEFHSRECWKMILGARRALDRRGESINDNKLIAELNFGFWVKLFESNHPNYTNMWRKIFCDVFQNYPSCKNIRIDSAKQEIGSKLDEIRKLRNRVFHYEPIGSLDTDRLYKDMELIVGWIEQDMQNLMRLSEYPRHRWDEKCIEKTLRLPGWRWKKREMDREDSRYFEKLFFRVFDKHRSFYRACIDLILLKKDHQ